MKYVKIAVLVLLIFLFFITATLIYSHFAFKNVTEIQITSNDASATQELEVGNMAYDFTLSTFSGQSITLSDLRGKIVVLNFWASWCGPCQAEMPEFQALQNDILSGTISDVVILSVNLTDGERETADSASKFLKDNGYSFSVVSDPGSAAYLYQISSIPQTYVITKDGIIADKILGSTDRSTLDAAIESARS